MAIVAVMFIGFSATALAQPCPTPPDCPNDPFVRQAPILLLIAAPGGGICSVRVHYCARLACGIWRDMYITGWELLSEECAGVNIQTLLNESMNAIWNQTPNAWGVTIPECPSGDNFWRVFTAGCYELVGSEEGISIEPCLANSQCWASYKVCRQNGQIVRQLIFQGQASSCPDPVQPGSGMEGCFSACPQ
jgi:hypothetical protein